MELSFYVLLVVACLVLLLAMWACAGSSTQKWGPDLTLELPPHLLQEALFGPSKKVSSDGTGLKRNSPCPSAPSEYPCDPLLSNEHPVSQTKPPVPPRYYGHHQKQQPVLFNMDNAVRVLPTQCSPNHKLKPVFSTFKMEEPV